METKHSPAPSANKPSVKLKPWNLALLAVFVLGGVYATRLLGDADLGFHLRGGKEIIENHHIPRVETYTYSRAGQPYVDLHWAYQAFLYLALKVGGYSFISLLNALLILVVIFILYKRVRLAGAPLFMSAPLLVLFLLASEIRFQVRPEIASWILMSLMLLILELRTKEGRDLLFFLPILQLVWANTEGLFPIGWFLMGAYVLSSYLQGPKPDKKLLVYLIASVAACLINPYFLQGFLHPFELLATIGTSNIFKHSIVEFQPPWKLLGQGPFGPTVAVYSFTLYAALVVILVGATFKRRKVHELLIAGVFLYLSCTAIRNIPLFQLATLPLAASCWKDLRWGWLQKFHDSFLAKPRAAWMFLGLMLLFSARIATNAFYIEEGRTHRFGLGLDTEYQPIEAADFLVKNHLDGRVVNEMNLGGWLDWALPQPIFLDGRTEVMGEEFYAEQLLSKAQKGGLASVIAKYQPEIIVMAGTDTPQWLFDLKEMPDWRLAFANRTGVVYLKKGYAPQIPALEGDKLLAEKSISRLTPEEVKTILAAPGPGSFQSFLEEFCLPQYYPRGMMHLAMLYHTLGDYQTAEPIYMECLHEGGQRYYDIYLNLGMMYFMMHRYEESKLCMDRVLKDRPGEPQALAILQNIPRN